MNIFFDIHRRYDIQSYRYIRNYRKYKLSNHDIGKIGRIKLLYKKAYISDDGFVVGLSLDVLQGLQDSGLNLEKYSMFLNDYYYDVMKIQKKDIDHIKMLFRVRPHQLKLIAYETNNMSLIKKCLNSFNYHQFKLIFQNKYYHILKALYINIISNYNQIFRISSDAVYLSDDISLIKYFEKKYKGLRSWGVKEIFLSGNLSLIKDVLPEKFDTWYNYYTIKSPFIHKMLEDYCIKTINQ